MTDWTSHLQKVWDDAGKATPAYQNGYRAGYAGMPRRNPGGWPRRNSSLWFDGYDAGMEKSLAEMEQLDEP